MDRDLDIEKEMHFLSLFYRIVEVTHDIKGFDRAKYVIILNEIGEFFHLSKGVAEFYPNVSMEEKGLGEYFCDYDIGRENNKVVVRVRIETKTKAIVQATAYIAEEDEMPDEQAKQRISLILRVILSMISRKRLQETVERFGFIDEAGFPNYRSFLRFLDIANKEERLPGMVAVHFDLHNFTVVNKEIGRENGDTVMKNYFNMMRAAIGKDGTVCRLGGDKFVGVFMREAEPSVLEILSGVPVAYGEKNDKRVFVSAGAGVYRFPENEPVVMGEIMDKITMPSAVAKRSETGEIVFYNEKMRAMREQVKKVQKDFREGLKKEEFKVFYQPKVDVRTREIIGAEALCRWFRDGKIIPPMEFIPILEMNSDICDLDFYMLDQTCRHIRKWLDEGRNVVRVSVNLSRKHLVDVDLLEHIMNIVDRNNVPHQYIEMELTETTTDVLFRDLKRVAIGLHVEGIATAVDDFGMGYSSLNLIREIPWNVLKIDRSFLPADSEPENSTNNLMFKHVAALTKDLGLECVVEGVETEKQVELLRKNHCDVAQGFYFDRPLPLEEFEERLSRRFYPSEQ